MTKLIEAYKVMNITWEEPEYSDPLNVLTAVRDKVRELPAAKAIPIKFIKEEIANNHDSLYGESLHLLLRQWKERKDE